MRTFILFILLLAVVYLSNAQNVDIPDTAFLYALIDKGVDMNEDSLISSEEAEVVTYLDISWKDITDLTGIKAFVNLDSLDCSYNSITSLDVSGDTSLIKLICYWNQQLTSLDASGCSALSVLNCYLSELTSLDISGCNALTHLDCSHNQLTTLDVSGYTALTELFCYENQLTDLDVSGCTSMTYMVCAPNQLTSLDVTGCSALDNMDCSINQLTSLDVSGCNALTILNCAGNQLTSLNLSNNTGLEELNCSGNPITSLDLSNNSSLTYINLTFMEALYRVCVWVMPFPPDGTVVETGESPNVYFTTDCTGTIIIPDEEISRINIYMIPNENTLNIERENADHSFIKVFNVNGMLKYSRKSGSVNEKIDLSGFASGVYFVRVSQDKFLKVEKVFVR